MVVEHRLNVLEPLQLWSRLVVVEDASIEHQASHDEGADGGGEQLGLVGVTPGAPHVEQT